MSLWHGIKGAAKYAAAVAAGDVATDEVAAARAAVCAACPSCKMYTVPSFGGEARAWFCGPAFEDRRGEAWTPTCGCAVGFGSERERRVELTAAGKTCVASESCPQSRWLATFPAPTTLPCVD